MPKTPDRQLARIKLRNKAREEAVKRMIERHPAEWRAIYADECKKVGVIPRR